MEKRPGDRPDGILLRDIHSMHLMFPFMYRIRCDSEAFISERSDLPRANEYLE